MCGVVWVVGWGVLFPSYRLISIFISLFFLLLPIIPSPIQNVFALYDSEKVSQTIFCCDSEMKLHCSFYIIYPLLCTIFYFKISIYSYGSVLLSIYSISSYNFPPEVTVFSTIYHTLQAIMFLYIFFHVSSIGLIFFLPLEIFPCLFGFKNIPLKMIKTSG